MATTVLNIIKAALRLNNVISASETPDANQAADAMEALNFMLDEWSTDGLIVYLYSEQTFNVLSGTSEYTIGSGGDWDGSRPLDIKNAILTDDNNDYGLIQYNQNDFMNINYKESSGQPTLFYYEQDFPLGKIKLFPEPDQNYTVTISGKEIFTQYSSVSTTISLPPGYLQALKFNLAINIANEYEDEPSAFLVQRANETLTKLKRLNNLHKVGRMTYNIGQPGIKRTYDYRTGGF